LPDGRIVELLEAVAVARDGDLWQIDVHMAIDGAMATVRVELEWPT
jgi:hypothetical protein